MKKESKIISAVQLAQLLKVDHKTIHNWVKRGYIKCNRTPGGHLRFSPDQVADILQQLNYDPERNEYLKIQEAAFHLSCSKQKVRNLITLGELKAIRKGGQFTVSMKEINRYKDKKDANKQ